MDLQESLAQLKSEPPRDRCRMGWLLENMTEEQRKLTQQFLDDASITHQALAVALQRSGLQIKVKSVERHRNRGTEKSQCSCP